MILNISISLFIITYNVILRLLINKIYLKLDIKTILIDSLLIWLVFFVWLIISEMIKENIGYEIFVLPIVFIFIPMIYTILKKKYYIKKKNVLPFYYGLVELFILLLSAVLGWFTGQIFI